MFLLHEVFGYGYAEIAGLVGRTEDNCRQIAARARRHVEAGGRGSSLPAPARGARPAVLRRRREGDTEGLVACWPRTSSSYGDGGGKAPALAAPLHGGERVARLLLGLARSGRAAGMRYSRPRSTASPACSSSTRPAACWASSPSTSPTAGSRRSARSSTPTSSATSARSAT